MDTHVAFDAHATTASGGARSGESGATLRSRAHAQPMTTHATAGAEHEPADSHVTLADFEASHARRISEALGELSRALGGVFEVCAMTALLLVWPRALAERPRRARAERALALVLRAFSVLLAPFWVPFEHLMVRVVPCATYVAIALHIGPKEVDFSLRTLAVRVTRVLRVPRTGRALVVAWLVVAVVYFARAPTRLRAPVDCAAVVAEGHCGAYAADGASLCLRAPSADGEFLVLRDWYARTAYGGPVRVDERNPACPGTRRTSSRSTTVVVMNGTSRVELGGDAALCLQFLADLHRDPSAGCGVI